MINGKRKWSDDDIKELCKRKKYIFVKQYILGKYRKVVFQDEFGYRYDIAFSDLLTNKKTNCW